MTTASYAALHRLAADWDAAPRIVTVTRKPAAALFAQFFGEASVHNLVLGDETMLSSAGGEQAFADTAAAVAAIVAAAGDALVLRFVDPATVRAIEADAPALIAAAQAIWLQLKDEAALAATQRRLIAAGFAHALVSTLPPATLLARAPIALDPPPDYPRIAPARIDTLVLLDNNLTGERGHYLSVAQRITAGALQAGARMVWAANARLDAALVPKGVEVAPVFRTSLFDIEREAQALRDLSGELLAGWRAAIDAYDSPTTHYLVPTTDGHFVRALDRLLAEDAPAGVIHAVTPYETRHMAGRHAGRTPDWHLARIGRHPAFGGRVFLWAETAALAARHAGRLGTPVMSLPLPAPAWSADLPAPTGEGVLTLAFVGEARLDKGPMELPEIAAAILGAAPAGTVRIVAQRVPPYGGASDELAAALHRLGTLDGVETIDAPLDDEGYRALVTGADAILLPYRPDNYVVRGSGILAETLAAGRIVLGSAGTVVEEFADEGVVFACATPADWATAVRRILADRLPLQRRALRLGRRFAKRNAPRAYVDRIAARTEFAAMAGS